MPLILLAEDSDVQRTYVSHLLNKCGMDVISVKNGFHAVERARQHQPDLILMDIDMPELNGLDACKILYKDNLTKDIPIVMISACTMKACRIRATMRGAQGYLTKPIRLSTLHTFLQKTFNNKLNNNLD